MEMNLVHRLFRRNFPGGLLTADLRGRELLKACVWGYSPGLTQPHSVWGREGAGFCWVCRHCLSQLFLRCSYLFIHKGRQENASSGELCFFSEARKQIWARKEPWAFPRNSSALQPSSPRPFPPIWLRCKSDLHSNPDLDLSSQLDVTVQEIPRNDNF